jgi:hypothetical protein
MAFCKVKNCRYPAYHVTKRHYCGKCFMYGHGQMECNNPILINNLDQYKDDTVGSDYCTLINCNDPNTHTLLGHCCNYCNENCIHLSQCPKNGKNICDPVNEINDFHMGILNNTTILLNNYNYINKYTFVPAGMGCVWYIRINLNIRQDYENLINFEYLFLDNNSRGQYGKNTSDIPRLNAFIDGYEFISL